ncbi:hypothetical protein A7X67_05475 [Clostridium sp. W14A]|nr:hypothetical protein A7X67_05475 [Clostridium sp. W14A]
MELQYLGTAAAEGIPALFCQCPLCRAARRLKGKEIRGRSGLVVDGRLMIDFPPDILSYAVRFDLDLAKIKFLVVTHSHTDHFAPADLVLRLPGCYCSITDGEPAIRVYGNSEVLRLTRRALRAEYQTDHVDFMSTNLLKAFCKEQLDSYEVTPLPAAHKPDEEAFIYLLQKCGVSLLYAHDTGFFRPDVFEYLKKSKVRLDMVSLDCTCCAAKEGTAHMGLPDDLEVLKTLRSFGAVTSETKCVINHFSHNGGMTHAQLEREAKKHHFIAAYDGMKISLPET